MNRVLRVLLGCSLLLLGSTNVWAQATAQINGTVADSSGAVLPGVTVIAIQTETGFRREVVTDETGSYALLNLPTGPYRLEVSLSGFRTYVQTGIVLQVAGTPEINVVLTVGALEETITVEGGSPLVDVQSSGVSEVVRTQEILALPLNGRNAADLVAIAGAAVRTGEANSRSMQGGVAYSVAGGQSFGVAFLLDGAMHNDPRTPTCRSPPDRCRNSLATSGLTAENGTTREPGNAVTKSHKSLLRGVRVSPGPPFQAITVSRKGLRQQQQDGLGANSRGTWADPLFETSSFSRAYQGTLSVKRGRDIAFVSSAEMLPAPLPASVARVQRCRTIALRGGLRTTVDPARLVQRVTLSEVPTRRPCGEIAYTTTKTARRAGPWEESTINDLHHSLFGGKWQSVKNPTPLTR